MRTHQEVIDHVADTLARKGAEYGGPTYRRVATMLSVKPQFSILVRILEKCSRAHNLMMKSGNEIHLREEFIDIACYAILAAFESHSPEEVQE
jgi:hypothetical protein